jgi:hypothetical protein
MRNGAGGGDYSPTTAVMKRSGLKFGLLALSAGSNAVAMTCLVSLLLMLCRIASAMALKSFRDMVRS